MGTKTKKNRISIPGPLAAKALFLSDRTCCVCRVKGKSVQVHHIDDDPSNNRIENFAVLCLECHTETQLSGGFRRKLDADQVILYRNDWLALVARERASTPMRFPESNSEHDAVEIELATSIAEIYREREEFELLASHYIQVGNDELRDKYVELAINEGVDDDTLIFFRCEQGRADLIPQSVLDRRIKTLQRRRDSFSLGRLYRDIGEFRLAVEATCKGGASGHTKRKHFYGGLSFKGNG